MAVGGGGGMAGAAKAGNESLLGGGSTTVSVGASIGLPGGGAGNGGDVKVFNRARITTRGEDSYGIAASSIGGGGGTGGSATASAKAEYAIGGAVAGGGGGAGDGLSVFVDNQAGGDIHTYAARSIGIFAQSVGGSGGNGGAGDGTGDGGTVGVALSIGGWAAGGGDGGSVRVDNAASIVTEKDYAHGVMAQSVGGSGGLGGAAGTSTAGDSVAIGVSMGGMGGEGGVGKDVRVNNLASGVITTRGNNAYGIFAQSVGGGGGAAGAGSTEGESDSVVVTAAIGGIGGEGNEGGYVEVNNDGRIETFGLLSHGIFAQSVGGGGGASGAAANATSGSSTKIGVVTGLVAGNGSNGGDVVVNNNGQIETWGAGAHGIMAQSVGGSGGYGGVVSSDAEGDGGFDLGVGGVGGGGGDGGDVRVTVTGSIITHGERAHGVVAQSVGGGGGYGGDAKGKTSAALSIGGSGGGGGDGGDVTVIRTGTITTYGKDSVAIMAQSVGGGGGVGGAGFGRFATDDNGAGPSSFAFNTPSGKQGTGGIVRIEQTGAIETFGDRGHGIVAQAVGGGGGMGGTASLAMGQSGAGSNGGVGDANAVNALANSQVVVHGASSYALFGQSATGQGNAQAVTLTAQSNLFAQGADSVAVYGESTAQGARGDIMINLNGAYTVGGSADGRAVMMVGGANNRVNNHSLLYALGDTYEYQYVGAAPVAGPVPTNAILESLLDDFSPLAISGTSGNDQVDNTPGALGMGRVIGNVDLGGGNNGFHNGANASMVGLSYINLGGGDFLNDGLMTSQGIGVVATIDVGGGFIQSGAGDLVTDIDLNTQTNDQLLLTGNGNFNGEMPLNFLSIDQLVDEYVVARGAGMVDAGITPTTVRPTVGFHFMTRVDNGTDLILFAEKPAFVDLINDPASGVTDAGVGDMAAYLDNLEAAQQADNPMARLINMLRFLPDEEELGKALTRLTPHYAVHTFEMLNRATDMAMDSARDCLDVPSAFGYGGRCAWLTYTDSSYERDTGAGTTFREDDLRQISLGGIGRVSPEWSLGAMAAHTRFESDITFNEDLLSQTKGESWQVNALAKYERGQWFVDAAVGGGQGRFNGERDTSLAQVAYIPGETLVGIYLPELLHDGIGNSVTYDLDSRQFGLSTRVGYTHEEGMFYIQPSLQLDARWFDVSGSETGSVAAFTFDGSSNFYFAGTPGLEIGADVPLGDAAKMRLYARGGIELSNTTWEMQGYFTAAAGIGEPLRLRQQADSPIYRVGAGAEINMANGLGLAIRYNGAFGENIEQQSVSGSLKMRF
jgi:hypothetical protein